MNKIYFCNDIKVVYLSKIAQAILYSNDFRLGYQLEPIDNDKVIVKRTNLVIEEPYYYYQDLLGSGEKYLNVAYPGLHKGEIAIHRIDPIELYLPNYSPRHKKLFIYHNTLIHVRNFIASSYYNQDEIDKNKFKILDLPIDDKVVRVDFNINNNSNNSIEEGQIIPFSRNLKL